MIQISKDIYKTSGDDVKQAAVLDVVYDTEPSDLWSLLSQPIITVLFLLFLFMGWNAQVGV